MFSRKAIWWRFILELYTQQRRRKSRWFTSSILTTVALVRCGTSACKVRKTHRTRMECFDCRKLFDGKGAGTRFVRGSGLISRNPDQVIMLRPFAQHEHLTVDKI